MKAGCSLRNGRLEFEPSAWGFTGGPLQPVSVPHYRRGVSGAGLDMVPSLKHSLVVARQVHGDKTGPRSRLDICQSLSVRLVHQVRVRGPWTGTGTGTGLDRSVCGPERETASTESGSQESGGGKSCRVFLQLLFY